jgi:hypothetical protein
MRNKLHTAGAVGTNVFVDNPKNFTY